jgi:hypothetical protein
LLNWIWGIGNRTWIALLMFIPLFGFIWMFVLGAKGNKWAWEKGRWDSIEQFKKAQRKWAIAGFIFWGAMIASVYFLFSAMEDSWAAKNSLLSAQQNIQVQQRIGTPIKQLWPITGKINTDMGGTGEAKIRYQIKGPKGTAKVRAIAVKNNNQWKMQSLKVIPDHGSIIVIINQKSLISPKRE